MTKTPNTHRQRLIIGGALTFLTLVCIAMTIMFVYVNNSANQRIDEIRSDYRRVAERRDSKVANLAVQVDGIQKKLDSLPDRTASKTADKVKQVVKEDEAK